MKFKLSLSGRGAECAIFSLTTQQSKELLDKDIEEGSMSLEEVGEYLGVEYCFSDCEKTVIGPYLNEHYITINNEEDVEIWNSEGYEFQNTKLVDAGISDTNYLIVEDYSKGEFFTYEFETDEFDAAKLIPIVSILADYKEFITGFIYDGQDISDTSGFGDFWSKGFYYTVYQD